MADDVCDPVIFKVGDRVKYRGNYSPRGLRVKDVISFIDPYGPVGHFHQIVKLGEEKDESSWLAARDLVLVEPQ